jgi:hypothetical protein
MNDERCLVFLKDYRWLSSSWIVDEDPLVVVVAAVVCAVAVVVVVSVDVESDARDARGVRGWVCRWRWASGSGRREERGTRRGARRKQAREYKEGVRGVRERGRGCRVGILSPPHRRQLPEGRIPAAPLPRCPAAPPACLCSLASWLANQTPALLVGSAAPASCLARLPRVSLPVPSCRPTRR